MGTVITQLFMREFKFTSKITNEYEQNLNLFIFNILWNIYLTLGANISSNIYIQNDTIGREGEEGLDPCPWKEKKRKENVHGIEEKAET